MKTVYSGGKSHLTHMEVCMDNAVEIRNLTKKYADFTLDNVNITLPSGTIMGFIGENGAGKSTTIKLMLGLTARDGGDIRVLGDDLSKGEKKLKEHIGVVLDECFFPENLTLRDINSILKLSYSTFNDETFKKYAERLSLPPKKCIKEYSRGMKMKLSIVAALSHDSKLLILDEATSGLDPIVRDEILDMLLEFIQDETHSVFISSHIISDLEKICDYITFIHKGKIVLSEPKDELLDKYGMLKCSEKEFAEIDSSAVIGCRKSSFGVEALVLRDRVEAGLIVDPATIEDIMLYYIKEKVR